MKVYLIKLKNDKKKYAVYIGDKVIKFGNSNYLDYTQHKNNVRKNRYLLRHYKNENWNDPYTAGFWATNLLWNKQSIKQSIDDINSRYKIKVLKLAN